MEAMGIAEAAMLMPPYGGQLVNPIVDDEARAELTELATRLPSIQLSPHAQCNLELLATGAFSPLDRFMGQPTACAC
jgi:sulfate adenylyltransferase